MKFGDFEIRAFVAEKFRLDGGTMFGVIPKTLWQKMAPADENNLIAMVNNLYVLTANGKRYLFDAGLGDTLSEREKKIYGTDGASHIEAGLSNLGLTPSDIDYVLLTHLHTDHSGGAVQRVDGRYVPRFPNAQVIVSEREWRAAMNPDERTSAVYIPERFRALEEAGVVELLEADRVQICPGVTAVHTGGHSEGHYGLEMESGDKQVWYYADIYPSAGHLRVPFIPATDVYPLDSMAVKRKLTPRLESGEITLAFDHDIHFTLANVLSRDGKLVCEPADSTLAAAH